MMTKNFVRSTINKSEIKTYRKSEIEILTIEYFPVLKWIWIYNTIIMPRNFCFKLLVFISNFYEINETLRKNEKIDDLWVFL